MIIHQHERMNQDPEPFRRRADQLQKMFAILVVAVDRTPFTSDCYAL